MKKTAVEWLIGRFHYEGFIGTYCSEEQIKSKRQIMIEIIEQAKEMEKQQIIDARVNGVIRGIDICDFPTKESLHEEHLKYYNETFKSK